jgi:hypothetical protein
LDLQSAENTEISKGRLDSKMNKEVSVAFINKKLKEYFDLLKEGKFEDKKLYEFINRAISDLKQKPDCGTKVPKQLWPKLYVRNYGITNLWKYDLPNGWRLLYTIETDEVRIVSIILEWLTHKDYEKRFKY